MSGTMVPSGLLGVPTGGPTATQGDLYNAIVGMGWAPQGYGPIPAPQTPQGEAAPTAYDKWGHVVTGQPQPQAAAPAPTPTVPSLNVGPGLAQATPQATPGAINPGASGYDIWGRQAPAPAQAAPQLPGLADILKLIQQYQAQQALLNANNPQGLLASGMGEGTSGMGGDRGADTSASSAGGGGPEGSGTANW